MAETLGKCGEEGLRLVMQLVYAEMKRETRSPVLAHRIVELLATVKEGGVGNLDELEFYPGLLGKAESRGRGRKKSVVIKAEKVLKLSLEDQGLFIASAFAQTALELDLNGDGTSDSDKLFRVGYTASLYLEKLSRIGLVENVPAL